MSTVLYSFPFHIYDCYLSLTTQINFRLCSCLPPFRVLKLPRDLIMRYVAAALLLAQAGEEVTAANIEKVLSSVGVEVDKKNLDIVLKNIAGKSIDELLAEGTPKLAAVGGGGAAAAPAAGGAAAADAPAAAKKEEKVEEEEEEDDDMGFGLFD